MSSSNKARCSSVISSLRLLPARPRTANLGLTVALAALALHCSSDPASSSQANLATAGTTAMAGSTSAGAGGDTASSVGGAAGSPAAMAGASGATVAMGGAAGAGAGGMGGSAEAAGAAGSGGASGGSAGAGGAASACAAGVVICEDFESYTDGSKDLAPTWEVYESNGTAVVDGSKPFAGTLGLHINTPEGNRRFADIVHQSQDGTAVLPQVHYGRMMVFTTQLPTGDVHWSFNHAGGPSPEDAEQHVSYSSGGMFGELMSVYSARVRPKNPDGTYALRGSAFEPNDPPITIDCSQRGASQVPLNQWVCWEWQYDAETNSTRLWIDGESRLDTVNQGTDCVGGGNTVWQGPSKFDKLIIGYEQYQAAGAQEIWLDDIAVGPERIGCPEVP